MSKPLSELLGWHTLCGLIQASVPGVPDVLPAGFDAFTKNVLMDEGEYTVRYGNRGVARRVKFGAPPKKRQLRSIGVQPVRLVHFNEEIEFDAKTMMKLRSVNSWEHDAAYEEFTSQVAYFNEYYDNLRKTLKMMCLKSPSLYFDQDGNLLPTSSGADSNQTVTVFSQPSGNTLQLNVNGTGNIIDAPWSSPSADIPGHIRGLKQAARSLTGYPVKHAIYGKNIPSFFVQNNYVQAYMAREGSMRGEYLKDNEIGSLFGLDWTPGYEQFWKSGTGTVAGDEEQANVNYVLGDNEVIFTPEPSRNWWERLDGSYPVPTNINIVMDAEQAMNQIKLVNGKFAYAQVTTRPIGALLTAGDTYLYLLKVPKAVFDATVA